MKINFSKFESDSIIAEKIMIARRAEGTILTTLRELKAKGIDVSSINVSHLASGDPIADLQVTL